MMTKFLYFYFRFFMSDVHFTTLDIKLFKISSIFKISKIPDNFSLNCQIQIWTTMNIHIHVRTSKFLRSVL